MTNGHQSAPEHTRRAALQLFLCAFLPSLFVFPGEVDKALPGRPLTCLLITKGHPAGTQRWPLMPKVTLRKGGWGGGARGIRWRQSSGEDEKLLKLRTTLLPPRPSLSFNLIIHVWLRSCMIHTAVSQVILPFLRHFFWPQQTNKQGIFEALR